MRSASATSASWCAGSTTPRSRARNDHVDAAHPRRRASPRCAPAIPVPSAATMNAEPVGFERVQTAAEAFDVTDDGIEPARREHRRVGRVGRGEHRDGLAPSCARAGDRTGARAAARRRRRGRRPTSSRVWRERRFLVEQLLGAIAQAARLDERDERRAAGSRSGSRCSSALSHGSHDSMPSNVAPSARRSHCSRPHGCVGSSSARAGAHLVRREQLAHREDRRGLDLGGGTLIGDRELGETIDLVTPEVDSNRVVGRRRVDVDDRATHRDLAAGLDLVLPPIAHADKAGDELVAVALQAGRDDDRFDVFDVRTEPLHERAHRRDDRRGEVVASGAQTPDDAQAPAHRLGRGRDALERQRLPRREQLDGVVAEVLTKIAGNSFGLDAGGNREHDRAPRRRVRQRRREDRACRFGNRDRARAAAGRHGNDGIVTQQGGQRSKRWCHRARTHPGTHDVPGVEPPDPTDR